MFVVHPKTRKDCECALFYIASYYPHLHTTVFMYKEDMCMKVSAEGEMLYNAREMDGKELKLYKRNKYELTMCEMLFSINFITTDKLPESILCPVCHNMLLDYGEGESICGHLTFTKRKHS